MNVDVDDRNRTTGRAAHVLAGDGRVVEVAEAAGGVRVGVMARRTAQRIGVPLGQCHLGGTDRGLSRAVDRLPGSSADRGGGIGRVEPEQAEHPLWLAMHLGPREMPREDLVANHAKFAASLPGLAQEGDVAGIVDSENRGVARISRSDQIVACVTRSVPQQDVAGRLLRMRDQAAAPEVPSRIVTDAVRVMDDLHAVSRI